MKRSVRNDKEIYITSICDNIEASQNRNKTKEIFEGIRKLTGSYVTNPSMVKDKTGQLVTGEEEVRQRWGEYFQELYNDPNPVDEACMGSNIETNLDIEPDIMLGEVEAAVKRLKEGKAAGVDNISADELKIATEGEGLRIMHKLLVSIWEEEKIPSEWKKAIIIPIHKKKDNMDCNNYRGISLLCHSSKIYTSIILHRIRRRTDEILGEEQAGFRAGRSTIDQIFTLRQMAERCTEYNQDLFTCYIDFKKAFDSVWRTGLWRVMRSLRYPEKIIRILEDMYEGTLSAVRVRGTLTDWFETIVGVLQGCVLSPMLFNIFLETVMAKALTDNTQGIMIGGTMLDNLRFADDIAAVAGSEEGLQKMVTRVAEESAKMGMKINLDKTETQFIGKGEKNISVKLEGKDLRQVKDFVYLGGTINNYDMTGQDIKRRIGIAYGAMQKLGKLWRSREITCKTKLKVYDILIRSIVLYNAETWTLKVENTRRLQVFEMACLRRIMGISKRQHVRNTDIILRSGLKLDLVGKIQTQRLKYFGHVERMRAERLPYIAMYGRIDGKRGRGRPRKRWLDCIEEDCKDKGLTLAEATREARDRIGWKKFMWKQPLRTIVTPRL